MSSHARLRTHTLRGKSFFCCCCCLSLFQTLCVSKKNYFSSRSVPIWVFDGMRLSGRPCVAPWRGEAYHSLGQSCAGEKTKKILHTSPAQNSTAYDDDSYGHKHENGLRGNNRVGCLKNQTDNGIFMRNAVCVLKWFSGRAAGRNFRAEFNNNNTTKTGLKGGGTVEKQKASGYEVKNNLHRVANSYGTAASGQTRQDSKHFGRLASPLHGTHQTQSKTPNTL